MRKYVVIPVVLVLGIQLHRPERANPPGDPARAIEAGVEVPPGVRALLDRACADCHSNRTAWPWYSQVAPVSWLVANHVRDGREHLNLSDWPGRHKPEKLLDEICEEVEKDAMPLASYRALHPGAKLSPADKQAICAWTRAAAGRTGG